jgi:hypothetical protein
LELRRYPKPGASTFQELSLRFRLTKQIWFFQLEKKIWVTLCLNATNQ